MILMADETPTNEELLKKIEILEQELDDMQSKLDKVLQMENACKDMGQKLANIHGNALADWWWVH